MPSEEETRGREEKGGERMRREGRRREGRRRMDDGGTGSYVEKTL